MAIIVKTLLSGWSVSVTRSHLVKILGKRSLTQSTVKEWMRKIKSGQTGVGEQKWGDRSDRNLKQQRVDAIQELFDESRH